MQLSSLPLPVLADDRRCRVCRERPVYIGTFCRECWEKEQEETKKQLEEALSPATGRGKFKCGICGDKFDTQDELDFHLQLGHLK
jgi:hypothetical protein